MRIYRIFSALALTAALLSCSRNNQVVQDASDLFTPEDIVLDSKATITSADSGPDAPNKWIAFRKDFSLKSVPKSALARTARQDSRGQ